MDDDSNVSWEEVLEKAGIGEWDCKPSDYKKISPDDPLYKDYAQCSHVLIYARTNSTSLDLYERRAIVLVSGSCKAIWKGRMEQNS